jgi:uncharacterized protein (TIGR03437 family)
VNLMTLLAPLACLLAITSYAPGQPFPQISTPPGIAQGAIFEIRLSGGTGPLSVDANEGFPLRTQLDGVSVTVANARIGATRIDALVLSTDRSTVRALLPSRTPLGPTNVWLTVKGETYETLSTVVPRKFTFLRRRVGDDWWPQDRGSAAQVDFAGEWSVNLLTRPAHRGEVLVLWGTGLGAVAGDEKSGPLPTDLRPLDMEVIIGQHPTTIYYAGRSGCCAGIDQINVEVPSDVEGCFVPVWIRFRDTEEVDEVNISISRAGECSDLPHNGLLTFDTVRPLNIGFVDFTLGTAVFGPGPYAEAPLGTCRLGGAPVGLEFSYYDFNRGNAGPALNVQTPQGVEQWSWEPYESGYLASDYGRHLLIPGHYTVDNGGGGGNVGPFEAAFDVSPISFHWTNADNLVGDSSTQGKDFDVSWNGGDPQQGFVTIFGEWQYGSDHYPGYTWRGLGFICAEDASKGHFTVPSYVWSGVRNNTYTDSYFGDTIYFALDLSVGFQSRSRFTAPGLDLGLGSHYFVESRNIKFH